MSLGISALHMVFCVIIETLSIQVRIQNPMASYFINFNAGNEFQCLKWISMLEMLNFDDGNEFQCLQCSISGVEIAVLKNLDRGRDHFWNIFKLPQSHLAAIWDI